MEVPQKIYMRCNSVQYSWSARQKLGFDKAQVIGSLLELFWAPISPEDFSKRTSSTGIVHPRRGQNQILPILTLTSAGAANFRLDMNQYITGGWLVTKEVKHKLQLNWNRLTSCLGRDHGRFPNSQPIVKHFTTKRRLRYIKTSRKIK
jgi:hypothetical protein